MYEHPVYIEYLRAYNRLYGRIRRKTLPVNTPLMDQLKELRDEYYKKYDETPAEFQLDVIVELKDKIYELLGVT